MSQNTAAAARTGPGPSDAVANRLADGGAGQRGGGEAEVKRRERENGDGMTGRSCWTTTLQVTGTRLVVKRIFVNMTLPVYLNVAYANFHNTKTYENTSFSVADPIQFAVERTTITIISSLVRVSS